MKIFYASKYLAVTLSLVFISVRGRKRIDELDRLLEVAKRNFVQLGGRLREDQKMIKLEREIERYGK